MTFRKFSGLLRLSPVVLAAAVCPVLQAQAPLASADPDAPSMFVEAPTQTRLSAASSASEVHKFWDKKNCALFAGAAALNTADFVVTRANLQSGGQELNPLVRVFGRSSAGLAVNFIGETAGVVSLSYFLHKTGHHKLERAVSIFDIGNSAGAVSFGLTHR